MNKALFLDRDGVINAEYNYVYLIEDFHFLPHIFELCKKYEELGYLIFVITNQAGIARGFYTEKDFHVLTEWMLKQFSTQNITIKKVYYCPHHPEITGECECRKPNPGMILKASKEFNIDLENSILIGDKESDLLAGINAGIKKNYLIQDIYNI